MILSKNVRNMESRWRMVVVDKGLPPRPRRTACQDLKSSMWVRPMVATDTQVGSAVVTRWANNLRAKSAADTVFGRAEASSWSR